MSPVWRGALPSSVQWPSSASAAASVPPRMTLGLGVGAVDATTTTIMTTTTTWAWTRNSSSLAEAEAAIRRGVCGRRSSPTVLELDETWFSDAEIEFLCGLIRAGRETLTRVSIRKARLRDAGVAKIAAALATCVWMEDVDLSGNAASDVGCVLVCESLAWLPRLRRLCLGEHRAVSDASVVALVDLIRARATTLEELSMSSCSFSDCGVAALAKEARASSSLTCLDVARGADLTLTRAGVARVCRLWVEFSPVIPRSAKLDGTPFSSMHALAQSNRQARLVVLAAAASSPPNAKCKHPWRAFAVADGDGAVRSRVVSFLVHSFP